ncbi:hypothetical protein HN51_047708, partial [Arachis hypogaea]
FCIRQTNCCIRLHGKVAASSRALNNYVEKFESRAIVPPRYITAEFIHDRHYNLVWNALQTQHLTDFVQTKDDYYPHLVRAIHNTLNYVVPETIEEGEEFITGQNLLEVLRQMRNGANIID